MWEGGVILVLTFLTLGFPHIAFGFAIFAFGFADIAFGFAHIAFGFSKHWIGFSQHWIGFPMQSAFSINIALHWATNNQRQYSVILTLTLVWLPKVKGNVLNPMLVF